MKSSPNPMRSRWGEVGWLSQSHRGAALHQRGLYPRWSSDPNTPSVSEICVKSLSFALAGLTSSRNVASASCHQQITDFLSSLVLQIVFASREENLNVILSAVLILPPALTIFFNFKQNPALTAGEGIRWRSAGQQDRKESQEGGCKEVEMEKQTCRERGWHASPRCLSSQSGN